MIAISLCALLVLGYAAWVQNSVNKRLLMNAEQAVTALNDIKAQNAKALGEIRGKVDALAATITALEATIAGGELPQAVADAIAAVKASSQELDDVVPDATV